jgi:hypothetical protein
MISGQKPVITRSKKLMLALNWEKGCLLVSK